MTRERVATLPADDWRRGSSHFQEPSLSRNLAVAAELGDIARDVSGGGRPFTTSEIAIAWVLHQRGVTGAIVGARRPDQVDDFLRAGEVQLSSEILARIEATTGGG